MMHTFAVLKVSLKFLCCIDKAESLVKFSFILIFSAPYFSNLSTFYLTFTFFKSKMYFCMLFSQFSIPFYIQYTSNTEFFSDYAC